MSRGLGKLQREILDSLDQKKLKNIQVYSGRRRVYTPNVFGNDQGCWISGRIAVLLPDEVHDLRRVAILLEEKYEVYSKDKLKFRAAFSRAVKSLIKRGHIIAPKAIKLKNWGYSGDRCPGKELIVDGGTWMKIGGIYSMDIYIGDVAWPEPTEADFEAELGDDGYQDWLKCNDGQIRFVVKC